MPFNRDIGFRTFAFVFAACMVVEVVLLGVNNWRSMDQWSTGSKVLGILVVMVPMVVLTNMDSSTKKQAHDEWMKEVMEFDPSLKDHKPPPPRGTMKWVLGGAIPAIVLSELIRRDPHVGHIFGVPTVVTLPFVGALVGFWLSPAMRADREFKEHVANASARLRARQQETTEERYQRERVSEDWQKTQTEWRQRMYEALVWWSSEGAKLTGDSEFILAIVHQRGGQGSAIHDKVMERYQNPNDPCSTGQRAEQVATWAVTSLPDLMAEHLAESQRNIRGLTEVLRHHHKREVIFHQEARAYALNAAVEARRDESPEHLVQRLLKECDSVALAREKGMKRIRDVAATFRPEAKEQYTRAATAAVNALLDAWLFARANAVDSVSK